MSALNLPSAMRISAHLRRLLSSRSPWPWRTPSTYRCMSTSDTNKTTSLPPLPSVPLCDGEKPYKLKQTGIDNYLKPLYAHGWFLSFPIRLDPQRHWYRVPRLVKPFAFIDSNSACQFTKAVGHLSLWEKVHYLLHLLSGELLIDRHI